MRRIVAISKHAEELGRPIVEPVIETEIVTAKPSEISDPYDPDNRPLLAGPGLVVEGL